MSICNTSFSASESAQHELSTLKTRLQLLTICLAMPLAHFLPRRYIRGPSLRGSHSNHHQKIYGSRPSCIQGGMNAFQNVFWRDMGGWGDIGPKAIYSTCHWPYSPQIYPTEARPTSKSPPKSTRLKSHTLSKRDITGSSTRMRQNVVCGR